MLIIINYVDSNKIIMGTNMIESPQQTASYTNMQTESNIYSEELTERNSEMYPNNYVDSKESVINKRDSVLKTNSVKQLYTNAPSEGILRDGVFSLAHTDHTAWKMPEQTEN